MTLFYDIPGIRLECNTGSSKKFDAYLDHFGLTFPDVDEYNKRCHIFYDKDDYISKNRHNSGHNPTSIETHEETKLRTGYRPHPAGPDSQPREFIFAESKSFLGFPSGFVRSKSILPL